MTENNKAINQVYNVALNERSSLNQLYKLIYDRLLPQYPHLKNFKPVYRDFRAGDVLHSQADITKARTLLHYDPTHRIDQGMDAALKWYQAFLV